MSVHVNRTLSMLSSQYQRLPYGAARAAANRAAVAEADQAGIPYYRIAMRKDLAWALAMGDDPATALPVCAEFFALLEEYPGAFPSSSNNDVIGVANVATYVANSLPQIPLEQWRALLDQFREKVQLYGLGEQIWQMQACSFYMETGDRVRAREHYEAFRASPRDSCSGCEACEISNAAEFLLWSGCRDQAEELIRPVLEGNLVCEDQPQSILSTLIDDDLNRGDLQAAAEKAQRLVRIACRDRSDLAHIGAVLRCRAYIEPDLSVGLLEKGIRWSIGMWDQRLLFQFYLGVWIFFSKLEEKKAVVSLLLPKQFPLYREDGCYLCRELAAWFQRQAIDIGRRFDDRNGSDGFARKLESAGILLIGHRLPETIREENGL